MKGCVMVCHTVSGLKCGIRKTPPTSFRSPKKHVGGVYFRWSGEIFLRNFMPYPPRKIPGLKGGEIACYERKSIIISVGYCMSISKHCNQTKLGTQVFENTTHGRCCQHGYSRQPVAITPFFSVTIPHGGKLKSPMTNRRTTAQSPEISISTYRHQKKHQNCRKW